MSFSPVPEKEYNQELNHKKKECQRGKRTSLFHRHTYDNKYYALVWSIIVKRKYGEAIIYKWMPALMHCVECNKKWLKWEGYKRD